MSSKELDKLYEAVTEYLEANEGQALVGAGVAIQPLSAPDKVWDEFFVCVKVCGKMPEGSDTLKQLKLKEDGQKT